MKKLFHRWWFWILTLASVSSIVLLIFFQTRDRGPVMVTETVERGALRQTVEAGGQVESLSEVDLAFETTGTIDQVFVQVGDTVSAGALIATLERRELFAQQEKAMQAENVARANLALKEAGATEQTIHVAESAVEQAHSALHAAEVDLKNTTQDFETTEAVTASSVQSAEVSLQKAEDDLEQLIAIQEESLDSIHEDFVLVFRSAMIAARSGLSEADEILGVDNKTVNDEFEQVLSNQDESQEQLAIDSYDVAKESLVLSENEVYALSTDATFAEIDRVYPFVIDALRDVASTLLYTRKALDATTLTSNTFTPTELSALEASIEAAEQSVESALETVIAEEQLRKGTEVQQSSDVTAAENAVLLAKQDLENATATKTDTDVAALSGVQSAETAVAMREADVVAAQAKLAEVTVEPRAVDLAALFAVVKQAEAEVAATQIQLSKTEIRSPIAGQVTKVLSEVGEVVQATTPIATVQTTEEELFKVHVDIAESDIAKLALGQFVEMTIDAFSDGAVFYGRVQKINPAEKEIEGIIFYEITILFDNAQTLPLLRPGLSVDATIITAEKEDVLSIPARAVLEKDGKDIVRIKIDGEIEEREVIVGLRGEDGRVEMIEGLKEGEEIVVSVKGI